MEAEVAYLGESAIELRKKQEIARRLNKDPPEGTVFCWREDEINRQRALADQYDKCATEVAKKIYDIKGPYNPELRDVYDTLRVPAVALEACPSLRLLPRPSSDCR